MKILVINAGSSSIKYQLIDMNTEEAIAKGGCERVGLPNSFCKHKANGKETRIEKDMPTHKEAIQVVLDALLDSEHGAIANISEIDAVGHRIVHSGEEFTDSVLLTDETMATIEKLQELAPLHQPANIVGVNACKDIMPGVPMVGIFDTAFHTTMPEKAYILGVPYEAYTDYKVRRYGFHGTSHRYVAQEAAKYLGREGDENLKLVTLHLGNGSSISAVKGGKSIDTSMSFTPLGGVPMGTRCGDLDPAIIEYLAGKKNLSLTETLQYLNKESGMLGLSQKSSDFRDLQDAKEEHDHLSTLALDIFSYSCKKYIGAYAAAMGGLDAIVFTAGVGEHDWLVRQDVTEGLEFLGIKTNAKKNLFQRATKFLDLTEDGYKTKVLAIPTNEELMIARDTKRIVEGK